MFQADSSNAESFGINLCSNDPLSTVPLTLSDGPTGPLVQNNWNNWNVDSASWVAEPQFLSDHSSGLSDCSGPIAISVGWSYRADWSAWGGVDNNGSIIPNTPNGTTHDLDYTGVGGQYSATVTVSGVPSLWGTTLTVWTLGDDYGGAAGNRWDINTVTVVAGSFTVGYPGGDGRRGGFIKALQISGPQVRGCKTIGGAVLLVR
jgi:hypothetical protein